MDKQAISLLLSKDLSGVLKASPPPYTYSDMQSAINLTRLARDNAKTRNSPQELVHDITMLHGKLTNLKKSVDKRERVDIDLEMYMIIEGFCLRHKEFLS